MATAIATVLIFLIMISLHEFGHFIFGKMLGFNVLEYAIGFGPAIFKRQGKKTLYSVRIIPFGGYCKFAGEDGENSAGEGDFSLQPGWKRIIVLAAGGIFNIILGFLVFVIFTVNFGEVRTNKIDKVIPGTYLEEMGVLAGDEIIKINGKNVDFYNDINLNTSDLNKDSEVKLTLKRDREKFDVTVALSEHITKVSYFEEYALQESFVNGIEQEKNQVYYSEDYPKDDTKIGTAQTQTRYLIGFQPIIEKASVANVLPNAYYQTKFVVKLVYKTVFDMITGQVGVDQLSGPVGVVTVVNDAVKSEEYMLLNLLNLIGLLTINLGIFNLLPLPALDGGRIIFVLVEMIRRKPIPPEKEGIVHSIGFLLLILLMIFVSYQDILRLFRN